ncbi:MAG: hypothetical protein WBQ75_18860 [Acetobacteraceae bacterium]
MLRSSIRMWTPTHPQKEICRLIKDGGGDYFLTVKNNSPHSKPTSPSRLAAILPCAPGSLPAERASAETINKEHGRIETRTLQGEQQPGGLSRPDLAGPGAGLPHHPPSRGARPKARRRL